MIVQNYKQTIYASLVVALSLVVFCRTTTAGDIIVYDAGVAGGGPVDLDPVLQGWTEQQVNDGSSVPADQNVFFLQPDGTTGFNAAQISDQHSVDPGYTYLLTADNLQDMFTFGWELEARMRSVQGQGFVGLGVALGSDPGWGLSNRERFLLNLSVNGSGDQVFAPTGLGSITVDPGTSSADSFHLVKAVGAPSSTEYELFVDGVSQGTADWAEDGSSNSFADDKLVWHSGSSSGTGRVTNFNYFSLSTPDVAPVLQLVVSRDTGEVSIFNGDSTPQQDIIGYSVASDTGGLDPNGWSDFASSSPLSNDDDDWTVLSSSTTELAESVLITTGAGNGGGIAASATVSLGDVWTKSPFEDLSLKLLLDDGSIVTPVVVFEGNSEESYAIGDMDVDGDLDIDDWQAFKAVYGTDVTGLTQVDAYFNGDIDGDGASSFADFVAYRVAYDVANGAGSLAALASVPEPATMLSMSMGFVTLLMVRGRSRQEKASAQRKHSMCKTGNALPLFFLAIIAGLAYQKDVSAAEVLGFYNADLGSPATEQDIQSPEVQGWSEWASGLQSQDPNVAIQEGVVSGSTNAWLNSDQGPTNPGYYVNLSTNDQARMWGYGWQQEAVVSLVEGTQYVLFGLNDLNRWGAPQHARMGFVISNDGTNMTITPYAATGATTITAGALNGSFARIVMTGSAQTTDATLDVFDFATDLQIDSTVNVSGFGSGNSSNTNVFGVQSGSSGGTGRALMIHELSFKVFTPDLVARVNETTGEVTLVDTSSAVNFDFSGYSLTSASSSLDSTVWSSLEDQGIGDNAIPNDGMGFEELSLIGAAVERVEEGNLLGSVLADGSLSYTLGNIFTGDSEEDKDLVLTFVDDNGVQLNGLVEYFSSPTLSGDFNMDGSVDGSDFLLWQRGGSPGGGSSSELSLWEANYGQQAFSASAITVPEPGSVILLLVGVVNTALLTRRRLGVGKSSGGSCAAAVALMLTIGATSATAGVTNDRSYSFGDDPGESGVAGNSMGIDFGSGPLTFDSEVIDTASPLSDAQDLLVVGGTTYIAVDGSDGGGLPSRPGASGGSIGASFDGVDDSLTTIPFNKPDEYWDALDVQNWVTPAETYPSNYDGILSRGIDFWVYPASTNNDGAQHGLIRDSDEHGVVITADGTWGNAYDNLIRDSGVPVVFDQWHHVQVVTTNGDRGSVLYINGIAVEANSSLYDEERVEQLVIGANLTSDGEFFTGVIDDMDIFLWGDNETGTPGVRSDGEDWGKYDPGTDNEIIASNLAGLGVTDAGDVNLDGSITAADATLFVGHYGFQQLVTGTPAGDWVSRQNGDLNYDGLTDLRDAYILHESLAMAGLNIPLGTLLAQPVPEPSSLALVVLLSVGLAANRFR